MASIGRFKGPVNLGCKPTCLFDAVVQQPILGLAGMACTGLIVGGSSARELSKPAVREDPTANMVKTPNNEHTNAGLGAIYRWMSRRRRLQFWAILGLMLVGAAFELLTIGAVLPFLALIADPQALTRYSEFRVLVETTGWSTTSELIRAVTILLIAAAILSAAVRITLVWAGQKFTFRLAHDIGVAIYQRVLWQPYALHVQRNSSEVIGGIEKVNAVVSGVLNPLMQAVIASVLAALITAVLFAINAAAASIAALSMAFVYVAVLWFTRRKLRRNAAVFSSTVGERVKALQEGIGGFRDIALDESQHVFLNSFREADLRLRDVQASTNTIGMAPRFIVEGAGIILLAGLALYMSTQPGGIMGAIPVLGALALGAQRLLPLLQQLYLGWSSFSAHSHLLRDIISLLNVPIRPHRPRARHNPSWRFEREIACDCVTFSYGSRDGPALAGVNLKIRKGMRLGIVGETGSGKSTLVDVLLGLLMPQSGEVRIDGRALADDMIADWQAQVAHVPQAIFLSDDSVAANIAFGHSAIDMERVRRAAHAAKIDDFIMSLPEEYEARIGERGIRISGGQRQRLGIARALYKEASVLILDEATSALDHHTETQVMDSIKRMERETTIIVIAHRLTTLAGCDLVIALEEGRVAHSGSFEEVIGEGSVRSREAAG